MGTNELISALIESNLIGTFVKMGKEDGFVGVRQAVCQLLMFISDSRNPEIVEYIVGEGCLETLIHVLGEKDENTVT